MRGRLRPSDKVLPEHARQHNRSLVLRTLFHAGPASRADLARQSGLTRVTISDLIAELLEEGLVEELGARPGARVGKPATMVGVRWDAKQVLALDLSDDRTMLGAVVDLAGAILERREVPTDGATGSRAIDLVVELCRQLIDAATAPLLGVGIASPGLVTSAGVVRQAPNLGWVDVPLADLVAAAVDLPVYAANDANTAALGEYTYGDGASDGLILVRVGRGVGAGILLEGGMITGKHLAAGEIGHLVVDPRGRLCACGRTGCLETVLSVHALREIYAAAGSEGDGKLPASATRALRRAGVQLGTTLAPIVSALDLGDVVVSGPPELLEGPVLEAALKVLRQLCMPEVAHDLRLRLPALGADVVLSGAAVLVLSGQLGIT